MHRVATLLVLCTTSASAIYNPVVLKPESEPHQVFVHPDGGTFMLHERTHVTFSVKGFRPTDMCFAWRTNPRMHTVRGEETSPTVSIANEPGTPCTTNAWLWLSAGNFSLEYGLAVEVFKDGVRMWEMRTPFTVSKQFIVRGVPGPTIVPSGGALLPGDLLSLNPFPPRIMFPSISRSWTEMRFVDWRVIDLESPDSEVEKASFVRIPYMYAGEVQLSLQSGVFKIAARTFIVKHDPWFDSVIQSAETISETFHVPQAKPPILFPTGGKFRDFAAVRVEPEALNTSDPNKHYYSPFWDAGGYGSRDTDSPLILGPGNHTVSARWLPSNPVGSGPFSQETIAHFEVTPPLPPSIQPDGGRSFGWTAVTVTADCQHCCASFVPVDGGFVCGQYVTTPLIRCTDDGSAPNPLSPLGGETSPTDGHRADAFSFSLLVFSPSFRLRCATFFPNMNMSRPYPANSITTSKPFFVDQFPAPMVHFSAATRRVTFVNNAPFSVVFLFTTDGSEPVARFPFRWFSFYGNGNLNGTFALQESEASVRLGMGLFTIKVVSWFKFSEITTSAVATRVIEVSPTISAPNISAYGRRVLLSISPSDCHEWEPETLLYTTDSSSDVFGDWMEVPARCTSKSPFVWFSLPVGEHTVRAVIAGLRHRCNAETTICSDQPHLPLTSPEASKRVASTSVFPAPVVTVHENGTFSVGNLEYPAWFTASLSMHVFSRHSQCSLNVSNLDRLLAWDGPIPSTVSLQIPGFQDIMFLMNHAFAAVPEISPPGGEFLAEVQVLVRDILPCFTDTTECLYSVNGDPFQLVPWDSSSDSRWHYKLALLGPGNHTVELLLRPINCVCECRNSTTRATFVVLRPTLLDHVTIRTGSSVFYDSALLSAANVSVRNDTSAIFSTLTLAPEYSPRLVRCMFTGTGFIPGFPDEIQWRDPFDLHLGVFFPQVILRVGGDVGAAEYSSLIQGEPFAVFPRTPPTLSWSTDPWVPGLHVVGGIATDGVRLAFECTMDITVAVLLNGTLRNQTTLRVATEGRSNLSPPDIRQLFPNLATPASQIRFNATQTGCSFLDSFQPPECHTSYPSSFLHMDFLDVFPPSPQPQPPRPPSDAVDMDDEEPVWSASKRGQFCAVIVVISFVLPCMCSERRRRRQQRREQQVDVELTNEVDADTVPLKKGLEA